MWPDISLEGIVGDKLYDIREAAEVGAELALPEQAVVEVACLLRWLEPKAFREEGLESLVAPGNGFSEPERALGFHRQPPERFVQRVDVETALG